MKSSKLLIGTGVYLRKMDSFFFPPKSKLFSSMHLERTRHVTQRGQTNYPQLPGSRSNAVIHREPTKREEIPAFDPLHAIIARKAPRESWFAFEISDWTLSISRLTGEFPLYPLKCVNYPRISRGFLESNVSHRTSSWMLFFSFFLPLSLEPLIFIETPRVYD